MKNYIYENYGIKTNKIYNNYFFTGDDKVLIVKTNKDEKYINKLVALTNNLFNCSIMVNTFIINKQKKYYTPKEDYYIILLKVNDRENEIRYEDIKIYESIPNNLSEIDFKIKFKNEIDILEEQIEGNNENKLINDSYNYFIGLSENAIQLLNECKSINNTLIHCIENYNKEEYNNPFNYVKGNKTYDIANYIKYNFYSSVINYDELYDILIKISDKNDQIYLFSFLMYADYYINEVMNTFNTKDEKKLKEIVKKINDYKELLIYCKNIYKNNEIISSIDWLL